VQNALKDRRTAGFGMDVDKNERGVFCKHISDGDDKNDMLTSLIEMENVGVTTH